MCMCLNLFLCDSPINILASLRMKIVVVAEAAVIASGLWAVAAMAVVPVRSGGGTCFACGDERCGNCK